MGCKCVFACARNRPQLRTMWFMRSPCARRIFHGRLFHRRILFECDRWSSPVPYITWRPGRTHTRTITSLPLRTPFAREPIRHACPTNKPTFESYAFMKHVHSYAHTHTLPACIDHARCARRHSCISICRHTRTEIPRVRPMRWRACVPARACPIYDRLRRRLAAAVASLPLRQRNN